MVWKILRLNSTKKPAAERKIIPSADHIQALFAEAENEQKISFEHHRREHEREFLEAELSRSTIVDNRALIFNDFIAGEGERFLGSQASREVAFKEAAKIRDEILKVEREKRQVVVEEKRLEREKRFLGSLEEYKRQADAVYTYRKKAYADGSKRRNEIYDELVAYLNRAFEIFVQTQEEELTRAQRGRDARVKQLTAAKLQFTRPETSESQVTRDDMNMSSDHTHNPLPVPFPRPRSYSRSRSRSRSPLYGRHRSTSPDRRSIRLPSRSVLRRSRSPPTTPCALTVIIPTRTPSLVCREDTTVSLCEPPIVIMPGCGHIKEDGPDPSLRSHLVAYHNQLNGEKLPAIDRRRDVLLAMHASFLQQEETRRRVFLEDSGSRDKLFQRAEKDRDSSEWKRTQVVDALETQHRQLFSNSIRDFTLAFSRTIELFDSHARSYHLQHLTAISTRTELFNNFTGKCEEEQHMANTIHEGYSKTQEDHVQSIITAFLTTCTSIQARFESDWTTVLSDIERNLGIFDVEIPILAAPVVIIPVAPPVACQAPMIIRTEGSPGSDRDYRERNRSRSRSHTPTCRRSSRSRRSRSRSYTPPRTPQRIEAGQFLPQTLLQKGVMLSSLPVPVQLASTNNQKTGLAKTSVDLLLQHHGELFTASQASRRYKFRDNLLRHHEIFVVNDLRRETKFREMQNQRRDKLAAKASREAKEFQDLMGSQNERFDITLVTSNKQFRESEYRRDREFVEEQETRRGMVHRLLRKLTEEIISSESRRMARSLRWDMETREKAAGHIQTWKKRFEADERRRNEILGNIAASVGLKL